MRDELFFNGKALSDFGVKVKGDSAYNAPVRDFKTVSIPGRNGDLVLDNGRYNNIEVKYPAYILRTFREASYFDAFRAYITSLKGYQRIEDTYHPEEYRMGILSAEITPTIYERGRSGEFELTFNCKPQRFLKYGERPIEFEADGAVLNDTLYESKPLLRVYGVGSIGIGSSTVTISAANTYTDIDCDLMDAYKDGTNCNANVTLNSGSFPVLSPGNNGVTLGTGITKIIIYPRFYTI